MYYSSSLEEPFNGDVKFSIALYHSSDALSLVGMSGTFNAVGSKKPMAMYADEISNLTLGVNYRNGSCEVISGTHTVKSIKSIGNYKYQVIGTFDVQLKDNHNTYNVSGKYQVTLSFD